MNRIAMLLALFCLGGCAGHRSDPADPKPQPSFLEVAYVGLPGPKPQTKTMTTALYGAYSFASSDNYCHMTRWLINNDVLPEYADEAKPVAVERGTKVGVIERLDASCNLRGQNVEGLSTELDHVQILSGKFEGQQRFFMRSDVHSAEEYRVYTAAQHAIAKRQQAVRTSKPEVTYAMLTTPDMMQDRQPRCVVGGIAHFVEMARASLVGRSYLEAKRYAESAILYGDGCHMSDATDLYFGLAALTKSKAELRLGELAKAKDDADLAAGTFLECASHEETYSENQRADCSRYRQEAHDIANQ